MKTIKVHLGFSKNDCYSTVTFGVSTNYCDQNGECLLFLSTKVAISMFVASL